MKKFLAFILIAAVVGLILTPSAEADTEIIRPTADNSVTWSTSPSVGSNYLNVDEVSADDDTTVTLTSGLNNVDLFDFSNPSGIGGGDTINSVAVTIRARGDQPAFGYIRLRAVLEINSTQYESSNLQYDLATYDTLTATWNTNPDTSSAWTLTEVNNLVAGYKYQARSGSWNARVTQIYVTVDYTPSGGGGDTCSAPDSGSIWNVTLSDNCYITDYQQFDGNLNCFGNGTFAIASGGTVVVEGINCDVATVVGTGKLIIKSIQ